MNIWLVRVDRGDGEKTHGRYGSEIAAQLVARRLYDRLLAAGGAFTIHVLQRA
jgi:hypothetical protein